MYRYLLVPIVIVAACTPDYGLQGPPKDPAPADAPADTAPPVDEDTDDPLPAEEPGGIEGRICAPNGESWVAGARVYVVVDGAIVEATTDGDGWFLLEGVPAGVWTVYVEKGSFTDSFDVNVTAGEIVGLATVECLPADQVRIAVVSGDFDTIEHVIGDLGFEFDTVGGWSRNLVSFLRDPDKLAEYDVIFFDCGHGTELWWPFRDEVAQNLRDFVQNGGSVYASDWAYLVTEVGWPDMIDHPGEDESMWDTAIGVPGPVVGAVHDEAMVATLGTDEARIVFDMEMWVPALAVGTGEALLTGTFDTMNTLTWVYETHEGPLAVRLRDGDGQVLYTAFHNDAQPTADMKALLREIILSL